jgi:hypothetical protein
MVFDRDRAHARIAAVGVGDEVQLRDVVFDHLDFLQGRHDQQLQIHALEQVERIAGAVVGTAAEGLVDHHEAE